MAPKTMIAKFAGTCNRCRRPFPAGTAIDWAKGAGSVHANPAHCASAAAAPMPPLTVPTASLRPIADFLMGAAAAGLKHPKARFLSHQQTELALALASSRSRVPGSINVYVAGEWVGRVEPPDGRLTGGLAGNQPLIDLLVRIAADPAEAAHQYGRLTCKCSFCALPLSDDGSVEVGYGPVCAKKWGLPWQRRGTRPISEVA